MFSDFVHGYALIIVMEFRTIINDKFDTFNKKYLFCLIDIFEINQNLKLNLTLQIFTI